MVPRTLSASPWPALVAWAFHFVRYTSFQIAFAHPSCSWFHSTHLPIPITIIGKYGHFCTRYSEFFLKMFFISHWRCLVLETTFRPSRCASAGLLRLAENFCVSFTFFVADSSQPITILSDSYIKYHNCSSYCSTQTSHKWGCQN